MVGVGMDKKRDTGIKGQWHESEMDERDSGRRRAMGCVVDGKQETLGEEQPGQM
jgi:hypothetical protein